MKLRRWIRFALLIVLLTGACLTARAAYLHAKAALAGVLIRNAWEESVRTGETRPPWPWADTQAGIERANVGSAAIAPVLSPSPWAPCSMGLISLCAIGFCVWG